MGFGLGDCSNKANRRGYACLSVISVLPFDLSLLLRDRSLITGRERVGTTWEGGRAS